LSKKYILREKQCWHVTHNALAQPAKEVPASTYETDLARARFETSAHKPSADLYNEVKLNIEGEVIVVHKAILAARSTYFHRMFTSGLKEAQMDVIELQDIPYVEKNNKLCT